MADQVERTHPLQSRLAALDDLPDGFQVTTDPFRTMTNLRIISDESTPDLAAFLGVEPPNRPNTWVRGPAADVVWLGPGEWLVICELAPLATQEAELRAVVTPNGGAAVDVSGQRVTLSLRGRHVRDVLAKGCPIDLHPSVFGPGCSAQTMLGRAGVVLLAGDSPDELVVVVRQSFATYLADWLVDAAEEYRTT